MIARWHGRSLLAVLLCAGVMALFGTGCGGGGALGKAPPAGTGVEAPGGSVVAATIVPEGDAPAAVSRARDEAPPAVAREAVLGASVNCGIWYPYEGYQGVPPLSSFAARGINATYMAGDINAAALATYDVIFIGRARMIGDFAPGAGVIEDIDALIAWINDGGGLVGESNALLWDSDFWRGVDWSSRLSVVAGISAPYDGYDVAAWDLPFVVDDPAHPVTQGVASSFTLTGYNAHRNGTVVDTGKNPTAHVVATGRIEPVVVASYGEGRTVNFPTAAGFAPLDWAANPDYETLFLNAIIYAGGGPGVIAVEIDIKPNNARNSVNTRSNGVIPVAILTTSTSAGESVDFDAATVDPSTVVFGPNGAAPDGKSRLNDADGDGDLDLGLRFRTQATGIQAGDTEACLTAQTLSGDPIEGCDTVRTVK